MTVLTLEPPEEELIEEFIVVLRAYFEEGGDDLKCSKHKILLISPNPSIPSESIINQEIQFRLDDYAFDEFTWGEKEDIKL